MYTCVYIYVPFQEMKQWKDACTEKKRIQEKRIHKGSGVRGLCMCVRGLFQRVKSVLDGQMGLLANLKPRDSNIPEVRNIP